DSRSRTTAWSSGCLADRAAGDPPLSYPYTSITAWGGIPEQRDARGADSARLRHRPACARSRPDHDHTRAGPGAARHVDGGVRRGGPLAHDPQAEVTGRRRRRVEPAPVVADGELDPLGVLAQRHRDCPGLRVLGDVVERLLG